MKGLGKTVIFFFGADSTWEGLKREELCRRNTCLLSSLVSSGRAHVVVVTILASRIEWVKKSFFNKNEKTSNVDDLFLTIIIPGQGKSKLVAKLNNIFNKLIFLIMSYCRNYSSNRFFFAYWPKGLRQADNLACGSPLVFDADHNIIDDENFTAIQKVEIKALIKKTRSNSFYAVSASRSMLSHFSDFGLNYFRLRNGVYLNRFEAVEPSLVRMPHDIKKPIIGYVGTISKWLDLDKLSKIAKIRPDWSFVIAGREYKNSIPQDCLRLNNIYFVGQVSAQKLPQYLAQFDIALNLYKGESWMDPDSMKLFEYIASGTPVVSYPFHINLSSDFDNLIEIAESEIDFIEKIEKILSFNIEKLTEWREKARLFSQVNTWENRAIELLEFMEIHEAN